MNGLSDASLQVGTPVREKGEKKDFEHIIFLFSADNFLVYGNYNIRYRLESGASAFW